MMDARIPAAPSRALTSVPLPVKVIPGTRRAMERRNSPRSMVAWLPALAALACGSRTPLEIHPTDASVDRDSGPDAFDAGEDAFDASEDGADVLECLRG